MIDNSSESRNPLVVLGKNVERSKHKFVPLLPVCFDVILHFGHVKLQKFGIYIDDGQKAFFSADS